jgi:hypothetical protein
MAYHEDKSISMKEVILGAMWTGTGKFMKNRGLLSSWLWRLEHSGL